MTSDKSFYKNEWITQHELLIQTRLHWQQDDTIESRFRVISATRNVAGYFRDIVCPAYDWRALTHVLIADNFANENL